MPLHGGRQCGAHSGDGTARVLDEADSAISLELDEDPRICHTNQANVLALHLMHWMTRDLSGTNAETLRVREGFNGRTMAHDDMRGQKFSEA